MVVMNRTSLAKLGRFSNTSYFSVCGRRQSRSADPAGLGEGPRCQCYKTCFLRHQTARQNKLECLVGTLFQVSLIFVSKARSQPIECGTIKVLHSAKLKPYFHVLD